MSRRRKLYQALRPWLERLGLPWLSRPGLNGIDQRLAELLPQSGGWFVEAGANDGFQQSNTYYLARFRGWHGLLIEPVPELAAACRRCRPESEVVECVLGPPAKSGEIASLRCSGLMTHVRGTYGDDERERLRAVRGLAQQGLPVEDRVISVTVRTLSEVLGQSRFPADFDLLSLDVEGYEIEVLKGLDLVRYRPKAICIEVQRRNLGDVQSWLGEWYDLIETLHENEQHGDYFWVRRSFTAVP